MSTKLLSIDANAKTVKGQKQGYMTAVLYLAPFKAAGLNVCPMAELAGCAAGCLNTAGRGGIAKDRATFAPYGTELPDNAIQRARIRRTRLYAEDRDAFMVQLIDEIDRFAAKAERKGLTPVVRLNGTSDIQWETINLYGLIGSPELDRFGSFFTIFDVFPDLQFYDYTKIAKRFRRTLPANYHLSLSFSSASPRYAQMCFEARDAHGANLVMVARDQGAKERLMRDWNLPLANSYAVDGDEHDLRFLEDRNTIVVLKAKGAARRDTSGFVLD